MLDERDILINKLSELVSVNTIDGQNDVKNVFFGKGQILVFGGEARPLTTISNPADFSEFNVAYVLVGGVTNLLQRTRELAINAANLGAQSPETFSAIQAEGEQLLQELFNIANSKDANGE